MVVSLASLDTGKEARMTTYNVDIVVNGRDNASGPLGGVGGALGRIGQIAGGIITSQVFMKLADSVWSFASGSIAAASNMNESYNKVQQIFGSSYDSIIGWSKTAATTVGLSQQAALDAASSFGVFGAAAGLTGNDLAKFGEDNTQLAADMASFYNTSVPDAVQAISAALRGETEPIRRYGVLIDDMSMRQEALTLGIVSTTKKALTPQQRVLAAQSLIMKQTSKAQGDFERTSGGLANQQRILAAQVENAQIQLGTLFLPVVTKVMAFLNTTGMAVLTDVIEKFTTFAAPFQNIFEVLGQLGPALTKSLDGGPMDNFKAGMSGFDNFIKTQGPGILTILQDVGKRITDAFGPVIADMVLFISEQFAKVGKWFSDNGPLITETLKVLGDNFAATAEAVAGMWKIVKPLLDGLVTLILGTLKIAMQGATGDWIGAWGTLKTTVNDVLLAIGASVWQLLEWIAGLMGTNLAQIGVQWETNWNLFKTVTEKVWKIIYDSVKATLASMGEWITKKAVDFITAGSKLMGGVVTGIKNTIVTLVATVTAAISGAVTGAMETAKKFIDVGLNIVTKIKDGISQSVSNVVNGVRNAVNDAYNSAMNKVNEFTSIGKNIVTNIVRGISSGGQSVIDALMGLVRDALDAIKAMLGIPTGSTPQAATPQSFSNRLSSALFSPSLSLAGNNGLSGANGFANTYNNSQASTNYFGAVTNVIQSDSQQDWLKKFR